MFLYSTNEEAQAAADQLQKLMQLQHWTIKVLLAPLLHKQLGRVNYNINKRLATIRLQTAYEFKPGEEIAGNDLDHERTLIHELVHLYLVPLDPIIEDNKLSEQIIENTAHSISIMVQSLLDVGRRARVEDRVEEKVEEKAVQAA